MAEEEAAEDKRLELTLGELCKTLVSVCTSGTLCTTLPVFEDAKAQSLSASARSRSRTWKSGNGTAKNIPLAPW